MEERVVLIDELDGRNVFPYKKNNVIIVINIYLFLFFFLINFIFIIFIFQSRSKPPMNRMLSINEQAIHATPRGSIEHGFNFIICIAPGFRLSEKG